MTYASNPQLELALNYVLYTNKNIFLTGKAGTGKTTFLQRIQQETAKRIVIVAPTGVAAINAGGVTIHSFFQLPFGPYLPDAQQSQQQQQRRFTRDKIRLIQSMDLLVIDEISMVRSDLLDGIDEVLRRYRNHFLPFGGVQLLMIGDLHQLPPVVKESDWDMLSRVYDTAYFFGSKALQKTDPVSIELKHIYRQSDTFFIDLLNKVRNNRIDQQVLDALNSRFVPNFQPNEEDAYITLTSHNASAQEINGQKLAQIVEKTHTFKAKIEGDFPSHSYPNDETIDLKLGAQVMFVKNDISRDKLYYNGKIGKITRIENESITVKCPKDSFEISVSTVEWKNVKYTLNEETKEIDEEILGSFHQYPLKLAWAITIHKSQGLTFERAIIDANYAFAHGQVYVALSRCKTFEGIVLRSKIGFSSVKTDYVVKEYSENMENNPPDDNKLLESKKVYQQTLLKELFDFKFLKKNLDYADRQLFENQNIINASAIDGIAEVVQSAQVEVLNIAEKFKPQIESYFAQNAMPEENEALQERIKKASVYFQEKLKGKLIGLVQNIGVITDNKAVKKTLFETLEALEKEIFSKNACFESCANSFSAVNYVKAKANAELDFKTKQKTSMMDTVPKSTVFKDMDHPNLYFALKKWRDDMAANMGVEEYLVLPTRVLTDICNALPLSSVELKRVKGFGDAKVKHFGADIIGMVERYCDENGIEKPVLTMEELNLSPKKEKKEKEPKAAREPKEPKTGTKTLTLEMYQAGKTIEEIAAERSLAASTIEGHLATFVALGQLDVRTFVEEEAIKEISDYMTEHGAENLSTVKEAFGDKYGFGQLRMVRAYLDSLSMGE